MVPVLSYDFYKVCLAGSVKVHIFWEGHKILKNLNRRFDRYCMGEFYGGGFAKFCALLRICELYSVQAPFFSVTLTKSMFHLDLPLDLRCLPTCRDTRKREEKTFTFFQSRNRMQYHASLIFFLVYENTLELHTRSVHNTGPKRLSGCT